MSNSEFVVLILAAVLDTAAAGSYSYRSYRSYYDSYHYYNYYYSGGSFIGSIIGGLLFVVFLIVLTVCLCKRQQRLRAQGPMVFPAGGTQVMYPGGPQVYPMTQPNGQVAYVMNPAQNPGYPAPGYPAPGSMPPQMSGPPNYNAAESLPAQAPGFNPQYAPPPGSVPPAYPGPANPDKTPNAPDAPDAPGFRV